MLKKVSFKLHKLIVVVAALAQLCLTTIHNDGLVALVNQYSGFIMFMFVLICLACLFNTTRIKDTSVKGMLPSVIFLLIGTALGMWLSILYMQGLYTNMDIDTGPIMISMILTIVITSTLLTSCILLFISKFSSEKEAEQIQVSEV